MLVSIRAHAIVGRVRCCTRLSLCQEVGSQEHWAIIVRAETTRQVRPQGEIKSIHSVEDAVAEVKFWLRRSQSACRNLTRDETVLASRLRVLALTVCAYISTHLHQTERLEARYACLFKQQLVREFTHDLENSSHPRVGGA